MKMTINTNTCQWCGKPLEADRPDRTKFCSYGCRKSHWDASRAQAVALVAELAVASPGERPHLVERAKRLAAGELDR